MHSDDTAGQQHGDVAAARTESTVYRIEVSAAPPLVDLMMERFQALLDRHVQLHHQGGQDAQQ